MFTHSIRYYILASLLILGGCLSVDNIEEYWKKSVIDPALAGEKVVTLTEEGKKSSKLPFNFIAQENAYHITNPNEPDKDPLVARTYYHNDTTFLLVRGTNDDDNHNTLIYPYTVKDGKIHFLILSKAQFQQLQENFPTNTYINRSNLINSSHIKTLDDTILDTLAEITHDFSQWKVTATMEATIDNTENETSNNVTSPSK